MWDYANCHPFEVARRGSALKVNFTILPMLNGGTASETVTLIKIPSQQTQNICIKFVQRLPNVFDNF